MGARSKILLLDHGYIRLVDHMGGDLSVVRSARVSYDAEWRAGKDTGSDHRLIHRLMKGRHSTPFESVTMTFEVMAPIFVFRQWHRHRTQSYNELSARYRELPEKFYVPDPQMIGVQDNKNKQARKIDDDIDLANARDDADMIRTACEAAFNTYMELLLRGVPRELARGVLPVNTYSHMFTTMNLWNAMHFMTLRSDPHAQYEIRVYSDAMLYIAKQIAPVSMEAYEKNAARWREAMRLLEQHIVDREPYPV